MTKRSCPLGGNMKYCSAGCAWFEEKNNSCVVYTGALELSTTMKDIKDIVDKMVDVNERVIKVLDKANTTVKSVSKSVKSSTKGGVKRK